MIDDCIAVVNGNNQCIQFVTLPSWGQCQSKRATGNHTTRAIKLQRQTFNSKLDVRFSFEVHVDPMGVTVHFNGKPSILFYI